MVKGRWFEVCKDWEDKDIALPERTTKKAAGYDFEADDNYTIVPIWRSVINNLTIKPQKVHTGIRVAMEDDEVLKIYNRSGNPIKRLLMLALGVGVVDADYYDTGDDITFDFWNFGLKPYHISKGDRIGQGVFQKFLTTNNETKPVRIRKGGNGSTDEN